jgi:hypothetical protein
MRNGAPAAPVAAGAPQRTAAEAETAARAAAAVVAVGASALRRVRPARAVSAVRRKSSSKRYERRMNFLQIAQQAAIQCGVASGSAIQTALPTVVGATGSLGRIVGWVNDAWTDIEMDHSDWDWMRSSNLLGQGVSFQTVAGQASYPLGTGPGTVGVAVEDFGKWDEWSFRDFTTAFGFRNEMFLDQITFDDWRNSYMLGAMRTVQTRPVAIAVGPDQSLCLGPPPNGDYTITGDYFVAPSVMVADTDVPIGLPSRFHMLIVYRVMMKCAGYESASELYQRGSEENAGMYAQLMAARAPRPSFGGALA